MPNLFLVVFVVMNVPFRINVSSILIRFDVMQ